MRLRMLGLAALFASAAIPVMAAEFVSTIVVSDRFDRMTQMTHFSGPVNTIRLSSPDDVSCRSVMITFADGTTRSIFTGTMLAGDAHVIALDDDRLLRSVTFNCRSLNLGQASIDLAADLGTLPRLATNTRQFRGYTDHDYWAPLGHETFGLVNEQTRHFTEPVGQNVQAIGVEAVGSDARCGRAIAHLDNGDVAELNIGGAPIMREGFLYRMELPGERDVRSVELMCRAVGEDQVTINIYGNKDTLAPAG